MMLMIPPLQRKFPLLRMFGGTRCGGCSVDLQSTEE